MRCGGMKRRGRIAHKAVTRYALPFQEQPTFPQLQKDWPGEKMPEVQ